MSKVEDRTTKVVTPIDVVQRSNPLVKGLPEASKKWNKRWPDIERPWPVEGTFNSDVIQTIRVLVTTYKASEKKGRKGKKLRERGNKNLARSSLLYLADDFKPV